MDYTQIEKDTFFLVNKIRSEPQSFIPALEKLTKCFKGKTYKIPGTKINIVTAEGVSAVSEAIQFLKVIFIRYNILYQNYTSVKDYTLQLKIIVLILEKIV